MEPAIAEDQGIRLEVVGAQQIDNVVLLYIAMQDVSGENRLTRNMTPDIELYIGGEAVSGSTSGRILEFNRSTNTLYLEKIIAVDIDIPRSNTLGLIMTSVLYGDDSSDQMQRLVKGHWEVTVNTSDLGIQPLVWTDVQVGDFQIEYMSLSPFGLRAVVNHKTGEPPHIIYMGAEIELKNRSRNIRPEGLSGGTSEISKDRSESSLFANFSAPIDIDSVTAVILDGVRIPLGE